MTAFYVGWGFRSVACMESFASCWQQACAQRPELQNWAGAFCFAVLSHKPSSLAGTALQYWANANAPRLRWFECDESGIRQTETLSTSSRLLQRFGTGSVSEALALQAAQRDNLHCASASISAHLLLPRIVSADRHATLAIAALSVPDQPSNILNTGVFS